MAASKVAIRSNSSIGYKWCAEIERRRDVIYISGKRDKESFVYSRRGSEFFLNKNTSKADY